MGLSNWVFAGGAAGSWLKLLEQQAIGCIVSWYSSTLGELSVVGLPMLAQVKSQCFLMNIGMSRKARNRWVFIRALSASIVSKV